MAYRLFELSTMDRSQLEAIAKDYKLNGIKKLDNEHLAYAILDAQAHEESVKPEPEKPKAKRGRPAKKAQAAVEPAAQDTKEEPKAEAPAAAPKKRGRKPKNEKSAELVAQENAGAEKPEVVAEPVVESAAPNPVEDFIPIEDLPSEKVELPSELLGKFEATKGEANPTKYQNRNQKNNNYKPKLNLNKTKITF